MKLIDAMKNIDKSEENEIYQCSTNSLTEEFDLHGYSDNPEDIHDRLKAYWLIKWYCTDAWVGAWVYYFDGEPFAVATQYGRKCDTNVEFISKEKAEEVRVYLLTAIKPYRELAILNPDEEVDETYTIDYGSQLLTKHGFYKDKPVTVVRDYKDIKDWQFVLIKHEDGTEEKIPMDEFKIPLAVVPHT